MKKLFALLLWLICLHSTKGQKNFELPETSIKVAYMGSVTYPGFKVGIEIPTKVIPVEKQRSWGTKTILKERYWTLNVGFYHHPGFHDNLYFLAERQFRRQYNSGFFTEFSPGLGFSRTFLGYNYLMVSVAGSIGYDLSKQLDIPLKIYLKPSFFALAPYNSTKYMRPTYEIGMAFPLGSR
jgi:hypothetical protein